RAWQCLLVRSLVAMMLLLWGFSADGADNQGTDRPTARKPLFNGLFAKFQRRSDFRYRLLGAVEEEEGLPLRLGDQVDSRPEKLSDRLCPVPASFLYISSERVSGGHGASSDGVNGGIPQCVAWLWAASHVVFDCGRQVRCALFSLNPKHICEVRQPMAAEF